MVCKMCIIQIEFYLNMPCEMSYDFLFPAEEVQLNSAMCLQWPGLLL